MLVVTCRHPVNLYLFRSITATPTTTRCRLILPNFSVNVDIVVCEVRLLLHTILGGRPTNGMCSNVASIFSCQFAFDPSSDTIGPQEGSPCTLLFSMLVWYTGWVLVLELVLDLQGSLKEWRVFGRTITLRVLKDG